MSSEASGSATAPATPAPSSSSAAGAAATGTSTTVATTTTVTTNGTAATVNRLSAAREVSHYVVTAHPPGGVLHSVKCNFLSIDSEDVVIAKCRRLEVRQLRATTMASAGGGPPMYHMNDATAAGSASPFPVVLSVPIFGRITSMQPINLSNRPTALLFVTTDQYQYAVIGYNNAATAPSSSNVASSNHSIQTFCSGSLKDDWHALGTLNECGPLVAVDPHSRCIVLHLYDGLLTVFPIVPMAGATKGGGRSSSNNHHGSSNSNGILGPPFFARLEEKTILGLCMLHHADPTQTPPHVCLLHQDSRGAQHVTTQVIDLAKSQLWSMTSSAGQAHLNAHSEWLKKSRIDGGSSTLIPVPPRQAVAAAAGVGASGSSAASAASSAMAYQQQHHHHSSSFNMSPSGGVIILGQRQITFCALHHYKVMPIPPALILSWDVLPPDVSGMPRYLLGDEFGNLHMLTLITQETKVVALQLDTLGSCTLTSSLQYLRQGLVFCGSILGDSQLIQIHDEPIPVEDSYGYMDEDNNRDDGEKKTAGGDEVTGLELGDTTYLSVVEEYTHLGPIVDMDLINSNDASGQSQVVTASGSSNSGTIRVIRNGIGMKEYASVELPGIQNMWSLRESFDDLHDSYLVQSFVGETRVLGAVKANSAGDSMMLDEDGEAEPSGTTDIKMEGTGDDEGYHDYDDDEVGGTLEEVSLPGLESNSGTLYVTNVVGNLFLQITETQLRLASSVGELLDTVELPMTVATANEAGQILVALRGGKVLYYTCHTGKLIEVTSKQMDNEVSCLDLHPFQGSTFGPSMDDSMNWDQGNDSKRASINNNSSSSLYYQPQTTRKGANPATVCAVGLWDDFTVRLLTLGETGPASLYEVLQIHLSTEDDEDDVDGGGAAAAVATGADGRRSNRNNMMARSLCLITLDFSSSSSSSSAAATSAAATTTNTSSSASSSSSSNPPGVDMLFVGLGDGTLVSFAVVQTDGRTLVQSKKEVSLGTQRINLIPLFNDRGGTCVLATGDRPTVIYLAGASTSSSSGGSHNKHHHHRNYNPKLCYSNVNLSPADDEEMGGADGSGGTAAAAAAGTSAAAVPGGGAATGNPVGTATSNSNNPNGNNTTTGANAAGDASRPHFAQRSIAVNVAAPFFSPLLFFDPTTMGIGGSSGSAPDDPQQQQHQQTNQNYYSLCIADDSNLRLGVIDDIQKLHVTTCRLGMAPRRIVHCPEGRLFAVGCIESGIKQVGVGGAETTMGNCIRFLDDTTFDDLERIDLEPYEMVLSMVSASLRVYNSSSSGGATDAGSADMDDSDDAPEYKPYLLVGTAYALHDEDEPTKGRLLLLSCNPQDIGTSSSRRPVRTITELQVRGGVYSMSQFFEGRLLVTVNSKTQVCQLIDEGTGVLRLGMVGVGHHGHILSLFVSSRASNKMIAAPGSSPAAAAAAAAGASAAAKTALSQGKKAKIAAGGKESEMLAIVGDLMRSISLVQYYAEHDTLEEVARDFNPNWTTAVSMLTDDVYLGGENWNNLFILRRNTKAQNEEIRCRLDTVGEFHLGEMVNKFISGSLVMPSSSNNNNSNSSSGKNQSSSSTTRNRRRSLASPRKGSKVPPSPGSGTPAAMRSKRPVVCIGSQTLFGTVDGTLGVILGLDGPTAAFFACLERSMERVITPIGNFSHQQFRAFNAESRVHPSHGFVDGDLAESFLDLDKSAMQLVVQQMNRDGGWEIDDTAFATTAGGSGSSSGAASAGRGTSSTNDKNSDPNATGADEDQQRPELSVEDVLAVVEEMAMLH